MKDEDGNGNESEEGLVTQTIPLVKAKTTLPFANL